MDRSGENIIEFWDSQKTASVTASQKRLTNRLEKLAKEYPDEVQILDRNMDGTIFAHVPLEYVQIRKPRQYSDETKAKMAERLREAREG